MAGLDAVSTEEQLVERLVQSDTAAEKAAWYADALSFLQAHGGEHWWCRHSQVTSGLAEVLQYHGEQPLVQTIWRQMATQLSACTDCVQAHHSFQEQVADECLDASAAPLLATMHALDCSRVAAALAGTAAAAAGGEEGVGADGGDAQPQLPAEAVTCLFEALGYDTLLEDEAVADGLAAVLCALSSRYELALTEPGSNQRYAGAYRILAHLDAKARGLAAATVRAWGPFPDADAVAVVLPTLSCWCSLLAGQPPGSFPHIPGRPRFRPTVLALWRALHGLLPLLEPEAAAAALRQLPLLADTVLAGIGGGASNGMRAAAHEAESCRAFAMNCWSHLVTRLGPDLFFYSSSGPAEVIQQLAAAARATTSERLHKAAAEAVAATLLHAGAAGGGDAVAALRHGLLFLLHDVPEAAAAVPDGTASTPLQSQQHQPGKPQQRAQQAQQPVQVQQPRVSQLIVAVAEARALHALLQLLRHSAAAAAAVFACAEYWLPTLCASLRPRGGVESSSTGSGSTAAGSRRRAPELFAAADSAAQQLAAALLCGEASALVAACWAASSSIGSLPGMEHEAVAAVASAAGVQAGAWHCLPAVWHALEGGGGSSSSSSAANRNMSSSRRHRRFASTLLLATAAALAASTGAGSGRAGATAGLPAPAPVAAGAGFAASGLASSLARDIAKAQELVPSSLLRGYCLEADPEAPSSSAILVRRGPAYLSEQLQQAAASHLSLLVRSCQGGSSGSGTAAEAASWVADPKQLPSQLVSAVAQLLTCSNMVLQAAAEQFALACTRQGSVAAAASLLAQLHPAAAPLLQPLLSGEARQGRQGTGNGSSNSFVRGQPRGQPRRSQPLPHGRLHSLPALSPLKAGAATGAVHAAPAADVARCTAAPAEPPAEAVPTPLDEDEDVDIVDLTDSPPRPFVPTQQAGTGQLGAAGQQQQAVQQQQQGQQGGPAAQVERLPSAAAAAVAEAEDVPWFRVWPSKQSQQQQQEHKSQQQLQQLQPESPGKWRSSSPHGADKPRVPVAAHGHSLLPLQQQEISRAEQGSAPDIQHSKAAGRLVPDEQLVPEQRKRAAVPPTATAAPKAATASMAAAAPAAPVRQLSAARQQQSTRDRQAEVDVDSLFPPVWPAKLPPGAATTHKGSRAGASAAATVAGAGAAARRQAAGSDAALAAGPGAGSEASVPPAAPARAGKSKGQRRSKEGSPGLLGVAPVKGQQDQGQGRAGGALVIPKRQLPQEPQQQQQQLQQQQQQQPPTARQWEVPARQPIPSRRPGDPVGGLKADSGGLMTGGGMTGLDDLKSGDGEDGGSLFVRQAVAELGRQANGGTSALDTAANTQQPRLQPAHRRILRLAAPPASPTWNAPRVGGGGGGGGSAAPASLFIERPRAAVWLERRAELGRTALTGGGGQRRQQGAAGAAAAAGAPKLTMDALQRQILAWEPGSILSRGGGGNTDDGLQGLQVPTRFSSLQQYTQVFSRLLLEEVRAHLQQAAEESPSAATICAASSGRSRSRSSGGGGWSEIAAALAAAGAVPMRLLDAQRQSELHMLQLEPTAAATAPPAAAMHGGTSAAAATAAAGGGGSGSAAAPRAPAAQSASQFSRSSGIRAEDLLLLVSRPAALPASAAAVADLPPAAVALAVVESVSQELPPEGRQQQGVAARRHKQLLLTMRVSLRSMGGGSSAVGGGNRLLVQQQLTSGTAWHAVRLMSLTPHLRQLAALVAVQQLPPLLLAELLSPGTTTPTAAAHSSASGAPQPKLRGLQPPLPAPLLSALQQQYNSSQQAAIAAAAAGGTPGGMVGSGGWGSAAQGSRRVVLVQGPPGTGKTSAILGMLSALLSSNAQSRAAPAAPSARQEAPGQQTAAALAAHSRQHTAAARPAVRVLLCAQSNAAVDELCTRLAGKGAVARHGGQRQVSVVRFGPLEAVGSDAAAFHIDALAAGMAEADTGLGRAAGQSAQLGSRLQALRQAQRDLQQEIDACDSAAQLSRERKRRRQERAAERAAAAAERRRRHPDGAARGKRRRRDNGGDARSSMDTGSGSDGGSDASREEGELRGSGEGAGADSQASFDFISSPEARQALGPLLQRKKELGKEAAAAAAALGAATGAAAARRKELRAAVVAQCEVVATTLSSAGGELLQLMPRTAAPGGGTAGAGTAGTGSVGGAALQGFDAIICDEAAQALEPSTLIALQLLAPRGRLVLVGDPQQLPATVVSRAAAAAALAQSLFERLMQAGYPVCMLRQQYRMHPAIAAFPSSFFYGGRLVNDASVALPPSSGGKHTSAASAAGTAAVQAAGGGRYAPWHARTCFLPLAFWDCREGREAGGGGSSSVSNAEEAEVVYALYSGLMRQYRQDVGDVAVLTPYKAQLRLLKRTFKQHGGTAAVEAVHFATVDGYQGREADVVIFSCVRAHAAGASGGVGFLSDVRRMNVALTRARRSLWVIGHRSTLEGCEPWRELMQHCRQHRCLFPAKPPYAQLTAAAADRGGGGGRGGRRMEGSPERRRDRSPKQRQGQRHRRN